MIEYTYDGTLEGLFAVLDRIYRAKNPEAFLPDRVRGPQGTTAPGDTGSMHSPASHVAKFPAQPDLFGPDMTGNSPECSPPHKGRKEYEAAMVSGLSDPGRRWSRGL